MGINFKRDSVLCQRFAVNPKSYGFVINKKITERLITVPSKVKGKSDL